MSNDYGSFPQTRANQEAGFNVSENQVSPSKKQSPVSQRSAKLGETFKNLNNMSAQKLESAKRYTITSKQQSPEVSAKTSQLQKLYLMSFRQNLSQFKPAEGGSIAEKTEVIDTALDGILKKYGDNLEKETGFNEKQWREAFNDVKKCFVENPDAALTAVKVTFASNRSIILIPKIKNGEIKKYKVAILNDSPLKGRFPIPKMELGVGASGKVLQAQRVDKSGGFAYKEAKTEEAKLEILKEVKLRKTATNLGENKGLTEQLDKIIPQGLMVSDKDGKTSRSMISPLAEETSLDKFLVKLNTKVTDDNFDKNIPLFEQMAMETSMNMSFLEEVDIVGADIKTPNILVYSKETEKDGKDGTKEKVKEYKFCLGDWGAYEQKEKINKSLPEMPIQSDTKHFANAEIKAKMEQAKATGNSEEYLKYRTQQNHFELAVSYYLSIVGASPFPLDSPNNKAATGLDVSKPSYKDSEEFKTLETKMPKLHEYITNIFEHGTDENFVFEPYKGEVKKE